MVGVGFVFYVCLFCAFFVVEGWVRGCLSLKKRRKDGSALLLHLVILFGLSLCVHG